MHSAFFQVSAGQLIANIDRAWHRRDEIRTQIQKMLPELQRRARINNELAVGLLLEPVHRAVEPAPAGPP